MTEPGPETFRRVAEYVRRGTPVAEVAASLGLTFAHAQEFMKRAVTSAAEIEVDGPGQRQDPEPVQAARPAHRSFLPLLVRVAGLAVVGTFAAVLAVIHIKPFDRESARDPLPVQEELAGLSAQEELELHDRSVHPPPK